MRLDTYAEHRAQTNAHNNDRQDNPADVELDPYLAKVVELAQSQAPEEMAIAVAAITGRRHVEVVAQGRFALSATQHRYLLHFEGQAKKRDDQPNAGFDILTLIPAAEALALIDRFRQHPAVTPLLGQDDEHPDVQAFHARVNRRVEKVFGQSGLVPVLHGFKTVSIHRLRALWGAIAFHFFAPGQKNPQRFLQHYLGHVSDTVQSAANAPVTGHYFHYRLWREGKELTAKGVKLAGAGVLPEEAIDPSTAEFAVPEFTADSAMSAAESAPAAPAQSAAAESMLEAAPAQSPLTQSAQSTAANAPESAPPSAIDPTPIPQPSTPPSSTKPAHRIVRPIPVDLNRLKTAAAKFEIEIRKSKGYGYEMALDQLLITLTANQSQTEVEPTITQAVSAQAKTLEFLTQEIEALRSQLQQVGQERDFAIDQLAAIDQQNADFDALQAENQRLKSAHTSLMQAYHQLLANGQRQAIETPTDRTTATALRADAQRQAIAPAGQVDEPNPHAKTTRKRVSAAANGGAIARAVHLFRAVQDWNDQHPLATFAITASLLKRDFGIHDKAVEAFFEQYQQEVDDYHQSIGVGNSRSHNRQTGRDTQQLKKFVATLAPNN